MVVIKCWSPLDKKSSMQSEQPCHISPGSEVADAMAQLGAEQAVSEIRGELEQLAQTETLLARVQRRAAAITQDICDGIEGIKHGRARPRPNFKGREFRMQPEKKNGTRHANSQRQMGMSIMPDVAMKVYCA